MSKAASGLAIIRKLENLLRLIDLLEWDEKHSLDRIAGLSRERIKFCTIRD